jgi:TetR/AcrR family transcriptional regulator, fatty acid biosynthesis regulator
MMLSDDLEAAGGPPRRETPQLTYSAIGELRVHVRDRRRRVRYSVTQMAPDRRLTRKEAKEVTRQRLLRAALRVLTERGETDLAVSTVAREAGIAQPSFYEHFSGKEELLRALGGELFAVLRQAQQDARRLALEAPSDEERQREQFRRPLQMIAANPAWFRLAMRTRHLKSSPLGQSSREANGNACLDLVGELVQRGYPHETQAEMRRLHMVAEGVIALTEAFALGHLSGRYPDIEEIVDVLVMFTGGPREYRLAHQRPAGS